MFHELKNSPSATQIWDILQFLKVNFPLNITPQELKISPMTKFHKLFKCWAKIALYISTCECMNNHCVALIIIIIIF